MKLSEITGYINDKDFGKWASLLSGKQQRKLESNLNLMLMQEGNYILFDYNNLLKVDNIRLTEKIFEKVNINNDFYLSYYNLRDDGGFLMPREGHQYVSGPFQINQYYLPVRFGRSKAILEFSWIVP